MTEDDGDSVKFTRHVQVGGDGEGDYATKNKPTTATVETGSLAAASPASEVEPGQPAEGLATAMGDGRQPILDKPDSPVSAPVRHAEVLSQRRIDAAADVARPVENAATGEPMTKLPTERKLTVLADFALTRQPKVSASDLPKVSTHPEESDDANSKVLAFYRKKVSTHPGVKSQARWKPSRVRPGCLIKRIKGYDISEDEYGVSYLFVLTRKPKKKTSADFTQYEHAGFFPWTALETMGRLVKESKSDARKRVS